MEMISMAKQIDAQDPMSRGMAYEHIRLLGADGKAVAAPFLVLDEELWDYEGKRFTLFFDPARVKRELRPHKELGRALKEVRSCTARLTIISMRQGISQQWIF